MTYDTLSQEMQDRLRGDREHGTLPKVGFLDEKAQRRLPSRDKPTILRPPFVRDTEKILPVSYTHLAFYGGDGGGNFPLLSLREPFAS